MGRGKVELKRIEDQSSRQVTFSKRRKGLMKKAGELSVLCDVDVGLIVFSSKGRRYEFSSNKTSLKEIFERYQVHLDVEDDAKKDCTEYTGLRTSTHLLQMVQRHFEEQNVEHLNIMELMKLEKRLDAILRQTKIRKTELMMEAITALHEKEKQMMRANQIMEKKIAGMMNEENQHLPKNHPVVELGLDTHDANSFPPPKQAMLHLF